MEERLKFESVSTIEGLESLQRHIDELRKMIDQLRLQSVSIEGRLKEIQATPSYSGNWKERR